MLFGLFLGTVQSLFYNAAGAKRNGATTFFQLVYNWINTFYKAIMNGLEQGSNFLWAQDRMNFYKEKLTWQSYFLQ